MKNLYDFLIQNLTNDKKFANEITIIGIIIMFIIAFL
jgi:hypothetical protein